MEDIFLIGTEKDMVNRIYVDTSNGEIHIRECMNVKWIKTDINVSDVSEIRADSRQEEIMIITNDYNGIILGTCFLYIIKNGKKICYSPTEHDNLYIVDENLKQSYENGQIFSITNWANDYGIEDCSVGSVLCDNDRITIHDGYIYIREKHGIKRVKTSIRECDIMEIKSDKDIKTIYVICKGCTGLIINSEDIFYMVMGTFSGNGSVVEHFTNESPTCCSFYRWVKSFEKKYKARYLDFINKNEELLRKCDNDYDYLIIMGVDIIGIFPFAKERYGDTCILDSKENIYKNYWFMREEIAGKSDLAFELFIMYEGLFYYPFEVFLGFFLPYRNNLKLIVEKALNGKMIF